MSTTRTAPSPSVRHLVLSGGGIMGFRFLGAILEHIRRGTLSMSHIRSIYGTSAGAMLATVLALFATRPHDIEPIISQLSLSQHIQKWSLSTLLELYSKKGMFSIDLVEHILEPFLSARGMTTQTSLAELYLSTNIDLHLFAFELNSFQTVELHHKTHPQLSVVTAVAMSSALPCVFSPVFWNGGCYIDGGMFANFPVFACLRDHPRSSSRILGVVCDNEWQLQNRTISPSDNLIEYWTSFAINAINHMQTGNTLRFAQSPIPNLITCKTNGNELTLAKIMEVIQSPLARKQWMELGAVEDANTWQPLLSHTRTPSTSTSISLPAPHRPSIFTTSSILSSDTAKPN